MKAYGGSILISSATAISPGSSSPLAPADSSVATIGSPLSGPWDSRNFSRGSENLTFSFCGSGTSCPLGSRLAPRRKGGRNTTVVSSRSSTKPVDG
ncbi:hypothetical protein PS639_05328 [Pseudomonas fluorescens]|nr:hypothetical protein PS639_05328 [Pseudomonas fluorescens]